MIHVPTSLEYSVQVAGIVWKTVQCDRCRAEYAYQMERTGIGSGISLLFLDNHGAQTRAQREAEHELCERLAREFDAVPCPKCGQFPNYMLPALRRWYLRWMRWVGLVLLLLAAISFGLYYLVSLSSSHTAKVLQAMHITFLAGSVSGIAGAGMVALRIILSRRYDPNDPSEAEARISYGQTQTISKQELEKMTQEAHGG
jgi:hypothetical protein